MTQVLIVGGGISGLATAWFLRRRGISATVLEGEGDVGGTARTLKRDGYLVDTGPTSTLFRGGALGELIDGLELASNVVYADPRAPRFIVKDDQLIPLPRGPGEFIRTPLFSASAKLRVLTEPFRRRITDEESIAQFTRRRLGAEFLDWAIDPFVSGVYAGDPERLSVRAAVPKVYALEAEHGSLFRGALAKAFHREGAAVSPRGRLLAFRDGMQALPVAIAAALGDGVQTNSPVVAIERTGAVWTLRTATGKTYMAPQLVLAVPAYRAAQLLRTVVPSTAAALDEISYAPVASVALGYAEAQLPGKLNGFGALFPRRTGRKTLGVIFSSALFPGRAPPGRVLLTAFIGGIRNPLVAAQTPSALVDCIAAELSAVLGVQGAPGFFHVSVWPRAIPQYEIGHLSQIAAIQQALGSLPGLHAQANWHGGVSFADCVSNGAALAARL
jgi:protoporphyrinogen/coproporphyrinogen III oxidase